jgi:hypothetical protein
VIEQGQITPGIVGEDHQVCRRPWFDSGQPEVCPGVPGASGQSGVRRQPEGVEKTDFSRHDTMWIHAGVGACQEPDPEFVSGAD